MEHALFQALLQYGYVLVFGVICLESAGLPLPGETALVTAAFLARENHFSIEAVIACAAAGAIVGDNIGYAIGRFGGSPRAAGRCHLVRSGARLRAGNRPTTLETDPAHRHHRRRSARRLVRSSRPAHGRRHPPGTVSDVRSDLHARRPSPRTPPPRP